MLKGYLERLTPLSDAEWEAAAPFFTKEKVAKGDYYLREDRYCNKVSFIESGLFKLFYLKDGEERIMLFFSEGQFVTDYFSFLTSTPSIRPIQAIEDSVIHTITRDSLQQLFDNHSTWQKVGRLMAERAYVFSVQRANRLLHDDPDTRFASFMIERPHLLNRVPQYMIASYLHLTPETLSRIKKRLMKDGRDRTSIHHPLDPDLI